MDSLTRDRVTPESEIGIAPGLPGHVKVRLHYLTGQPKHLRSMLLAQYGAEPPFVEEVYVLLPHMTIFPYLECFLPVFETLKKEEIIPGDAEPQGFKILDHDYLTQSYVL